MAQSQDEYAALPPEEQRAHDERQRAREQAEQAALPYLWTQTLEHVEVSLPVPEGTRAKQVQVDMKRTRLRVAVQGNEIVSGELAKPIKEEDSTWTIDDGKMLSIHLEKVNRNEWWAHVVTHHPRIDTTKITPENSKLSDLDGETRAMVEKMMVRQDSMRSAPGLTEPFQFDNRQKQMGLPTSDQLQQQEMLAKMQKQIDAERK